MTSRSVMRGHPTTSSRCLASPISPCYREALPPSGRGLPWAPWVQSPSKEHQMAELLTGIRIVVNDNDDNRVIM